MGSPLSKKHKISVSYFQMCLMARLKALGILRWNLGSDIKLSDLRSSVMVLIDVSPTSSVQYPTTLTPLVRLSVFVKCCGFI